MAGDIARYIAATITSDRRSTRIRSSKLNKHSSLPLAIKPTV